MCSLINASSVTLNALKIGLCVSCKVRASGSLCYGKLAPVMVDTYAQCCRLQLVFFFLYASLSLLIFFSSATFLKNISRV